MDKFITTRSRFPAIHMASAGISELDELYGYVIHAVPVHDRTEIRYNPEFLRTFTYHIPNFGETPEYIKLRDRSEHLRTLLRDLSPNAPTAADYNIFHIPKASGGLRTITAPNTELKTTQQKILKVFQHDMRVNVHDCAFAYVQHRTIRDALVRHQANNSKWFLKIDLQDFFPSLDKAFLLQQLERNATFHPSTTTEMYYGRIASGRIDRILDYCLYNNALPQGAPTSPILSNLAMIPIDYELTKRLWEFEGHHFVYTRYADDLLISSYTKFDPQDVVNLLVAILEPTPLKINPAKIRFGSSSGSNWNLGLMLNRDNDITVGHKTKEHFRTLLHRFLTSAEAGHPWPPEETRSLEGQRAWIYSIEPEWTNRIVRDYESSYSTHPYRDIVKAILS